MAGGGGDGAGAGSESFDHAFVGDGGDFRIAASDFRNAHAA